MRGKITPILFLILTASLLLYIFFSFPSLSDYFKNTFKKPADKTFEGTAWFKFDEKDALKEWEEKVFKGKVFYSIKTDTSDGYLAAYSKNSASGIFHRLKFNPKEKPMVSWKWKAVQFPEKKGGVVEKSKWVEKDDYAARFYIIFPRTPYSRTQCLEYVWDQNLPEGTILTNPRLKNLKIIVLESGEKNLGQWVYEERNILEDFKKVFGSTPGNARAIAIMTDAENTASTAEAQYDEIKVGYEK